MVVHFKSAVFGSTQNSVFGCVRSLLPLLVGGCDGLVSESDGKADLLSDHFRCKQSKKFA